MAIDKSLKRTGRLRRSRNVLTREERIAKLQYEDRWEEGSSPFGLRKIRVVKTVIGKKRKKITAGRRGRNGRRFTPRSSPKWTKSRTASALRSSKPIAWIMQTPPCGTN